MTETSRVARALKEITKCDKLNIAALGNVVPQLHVHVIARRTSDAAWPRPVWGVMPPLAHDAEEVQNFISALRARFGWVELMSAIRFAFHSAVRLSSPTFSTAPRTCARNDEKLFALEGQRDTRAYVIHRDSLVMKQDGGGPRALLTINEALKFGANPGTIFLGLRDGAPFFGMGICGGGG